MCKPAAAKERSLLRTIPHLLAVLMLEQGTAVWAQEQSRPLRDLSVVKTQPPDGALKTKDDTRPPSFLTDWSTEGSGASWAVAPGFEQTPAGLRKVTLSPSWLALGPAWQFNLRASTKAPGGIRFTAHAGATGGQRLPTAVDFLDGHPDPSFAQLDPAMRQTVWSAGIAVDRTFTLGAVDLTLFGEALFVRGKLPNKNGPSTDEKPVRTTAGVRLKF